MKMQSRHVKKLLHRKHLFLFIISFVIALSGSLTSCVEQLRSKWYFKEAGTLLWLDESYSDETIKAAIGEVLDHSSMIVAQASWSPSEASLDNTIQWYAQLAKDHGKSLMVNVDWLDNDRFETRGGDWSFADEEVRQQFQDELKAVVTKYSPDYLTVGVEVNYYGLTDSEGYSEFIKVYNALKPELKKLHPKIKIGMSFQLELLVGQHTNWQQDSTFEGLNAVVENLDYIGISTYPDVYIPRGEELDALNHLDNICATYDLPVGITETGISTLHFSDEQRISYVQNIFSKMEKLDMKFLVWGAILDDTKEYEEESEWKKSIGLIKASGERKPELEDWETSIVKITN